MLSPLQESSEKPKSIRNEETSGKSDCKSVAVDVDDDIFNLNSFVDKHEYNYLRGGKRKKEQEDKIVLGAEGNKKSATHTSGENEDLSRERGDERKRRRRRSTTREKTK